MKLRGERQKALGKRDLDLDAIRGIAILLAMGWHFNGRPFNIPGLDQVLAPGRQIGWAGVDLFFVLSGFLVGSLILREVQKTGRFDARRFMGRRILRLWPVLYAYLAVQLIVQEHPWRTYLVQNIFQVQNYTGSSLAQMWSLAVEEHFYLILAIAFPLMARWRTRPRTLLAILAAVILSSLALRIIAVLADTDPITVQQQTHFRADALAVGAVLAVVAVHYPGIFEQLLSWRPVWAIVLLAGCLWLWHVPKDSTAGLTIGFSVAAVTGMAGLLLVHRSQHVQRATYVTRPLATLGVYSYSLYIWHPAAANAVEKATSAAGLHPDRLALTVMDYVAAVLVSVIVARTVEWPSMMIRDRIFPRRQDPIDLRTPANTSRNMMGI